MTFQAGIPLATDLISVSQDDLKNNFTALSSAWNIDHVDFNATGAGDHKKVTLLAPIADPNQVSPIASIYTKASGGGTSDLYYQNGNAASNVVQITGGGISAAAWVTFDGTGGNPITPAAGAAYNVTNISHPLAGTYTINFTRQISLPYATLVTPSFSSTGVAISITSQLSTSVTFELKSAGTKTDSNIVNVVIFGKQA